MQGYGNCLEQFPVWYMYSMNAIYMYTLKQ